MSVIRVGRFDSFRGENALLIEADRLGFAALIRGIEEVQKASVCVALHDLPEATPYGGVRCTLELASEDRGLIAHGVRDFAWRRSRSGWADVMDKLRVLQESPTPGHHYLDGPTDDLQVVAAVDEYGERWWNSHAG